MSSRYYEGRICRWCDEEFDPRKFQQHSRDSQVCFSCIREICTNNLTIIDARVEGMCRRTFELCGRRVKRPEREMIRDYHGYKFFLRSIM